MGYSKAPEQPQISARPMCHSHTMMSIGRDPATICIATYRSSPHYVPHHGRRLSANDTTKKELSLSKSVTGNSHL